MRLAAWATVTAGSESILECAVTPKPPSDGSLPARTSGGLDAGMTPTRPKSGTNGGLWFRDFTKSILLSGQHRHPLKKKRTLYFNKGWGVPMCQAVTKKGKGKTCENGDAWFDERSQSWLCHLHHPEGLYRKQVDAKREDRKQGRQRP